MKSRSHRLPPSSLDQKDDWVEESWTVDCVCGVNYDDGEEMVDCDECGVWVHTRCSRYVKTDKSFVCDKCKNNNNHNSNHHHLHRNNNNDSSEETEVAQLLVELPTKTLRRMHSNPLPPAPSSSYKSSALTASSRPVRLWTDIPIEDRVHVQGTPGGDDPALFTGISAVFGPQLWKCTGYIPKKFSFRYREFPCWDEEEDVLEKEDSDKKIKRQSNVSADNGAGVLFALAKLDVTQQKGPTASNGVDSVGAEKQAEVAKGSDGLMSSKETCKLEGLNLDVSMQQNEVVKDRSSLKPPFLHFEKRRREDLLNNKDRSGKKKSRTLEKDGDSNKKIRLHSPDRGPMAVEVDPPCGKGENLSYPLPTGHLSLDAVVVDHAIDAQKSNSKENGRHQVPLKLEGSSKIIIGSSSLLQGNTVPVPTKEEVTSVTAVTPNVLVGELLASDGTCMQQLEQINEDLASSRPKTEDDRSAPDSSINTLSSCPEIQAKLETELADCSRNTNKLSCFNDAKLSSSGTSFQSQDVSAHRSSEDVSVSDTNVTDLVAIKVENDVRTSEADVHELKVDGESPHRSWEPKHDSADSDRVPGLKNFSFSFGSNAELESNKPTVMVPSPRVATDEGKTTASVASSIPAPSAILIPKSPASENCNAGVTSHNNNVDSKVKWVRESSLTGALTDVVEDEVRHEKARRLVKEHSKSALPSVPKSSQLKKISHAAIVSKRTSSDLRDSRLDSSSSPTLVPPIASHPASELANVQQIESNLNIQKMASPSQFESASNIQKKVTCSLLSHKVEKINPSLAQSLSKVNNTSSHAAASSNSPSTLSDEELALLLHQELNSSPRVPRVPRMRHAGSLPQLTSPTATSMLMKRTSSTGGKDNVLAFRRRTKDLAKDGSYGFAEMDDEAKKMDRVSSSMEHRRQDSAFISDSVSKREVDNGSANGLYSIKKSNAPSRRAGSSSLSSPAEGNESNFSAARLSPRIPSDDEKGVGRLSHRTLPGLLAEIMSEGKRMTYEELCNSVLPHWPYLRKHNGERYAYSSHSQAVLDCLRNRNEWARLVDRGPKTSGGRKRRKPDAGVESEDNDDGRAAKDGSRSKTMESHREEFTKGKRKARKCKRLALRGRGIKDVRRRPKTDEVSEEEDGSFSDSSEETLFSEEEVQGSGMSASGNDVSANSEGM